MCMVAHNGIGADVDSEAMGKCKQACFDLVSPMFERSAAV